MLAEHFLTIGAQLGEGPTWIEGALWFVDIKNNTIFRVDPATKDVTRWSAPEHVGWVLPSAVHGLIAGLQSGPHRFDPADGSFTRIAQVHADQPDNRLNDAAIDAEGRIWFGSMDNLEESESGAVFVLDKGAVTRTPIPAITITNGPAISPCGGFVYHVDTLARTVTRFAIGADGTPDTGTPFLDFNTPERADWGYPDGAICDAEGGVWQGFFSGGAARRFAPDGTLTDEVRFPVSNITKITLGGEDGRTAFATSARQGLSEQELAEQTMAGDIFTFRVAVPAAPVRKANT
ncbi:SMP-30/gluconolactonase/LRE family protein [Novosphingobium sp. 1949]|uniref:SMP-30/gluconolactonase/LRE family protein n=1 Tax=Novosphingobium organovorum TaxID=2930092 RepID=A0ABT0BDA3_9SPHN|nr:SMP-30/gluconolactonase/LRE family protein [Novosphingobium organovorum]MCJ2182823.1 SMP-30/gluconolactonase/LRE family protein [Novosphingobium organovorum]